MISGVYTISNIINNKVYVGYSNDVLRRLSGHKSKLTSNKHHCIHLQRAINEYGIDNFKFELLTECPEEILASEEHYWSNLLNSHSDNYGYNDKPTDPRNRPTHSEITKIKIKEKRAKQIITEEQKKKQSLTMTGIKKSEEHKRNISKGRKGIVFTEEHKLNMIPYRFRKIKEVFPDGTSKEWNSTKEAALFYNVKPCNIWKMLQDSERKSRTIKGKFYYIN